ncbi:uncharacterized protein LOC133189505 [Saccostrea echinata]|uniref:uncharacterized protein LOC133189505 n=1 Tax=Saccostrea echinata TaxID=191078 RepID=UPI002A82511E|nr:uncharacterized protein LOC133189505 [Saccostrea echinata]
MVFLGNGNIAVSLVSPEGDSRGFLTSNHWISYSLDLSSYFACTNHCYLLSQKRGGYQMQHRKFQPSRTCDYVHFLSFKNGSMKVESSTCNIDRRIQELWCRPEMPIDLEIQKNGFTPTGIAVCKSKAILICLWNNKAHEKSLGKVLKLNTDGHKILEIQYQNNLPYFTCPTYITENGNGDICFSDVDRVVVTDAVGFLRFQYKGLPSDTHFDPYGVCCDSKNNIITADMTNDKIHMFDQNGSFLHYIQYKNMKMPRALCNDENDYLYVGERLCDEIKVISIL